MTDSQGRPPDPPSGILVCRDLFFTSKVTGTAQALGLRIVVAGTRDAILQHLSAGGVKTVFVDLTAGDAASPEAIRLYDEAAPTVQLVGFGSHVDVEALKAASEAGCDIVLPRSRFSAELPEILRRSCGASQA